jgi:hypothetical protein
MRDIASDLLQIVIIVLLIVIFMILLDINKTLEKATFPRYYVSNNQWDVTAAVRGSVIIKDSKEKK